MKRLPSWKYDFRALHRTITIGGICNFLVSFRSPTRLRILRSLMVTGPKATAFSLGKSLRQSPSLISKSLLFLETAGLVKVYEEKPWRTGLSSKAFGLTFLGFLVGLNSYIMRFDIDEASLFQNIRRIEELLLDLRSMGEGLLLSAQQILKTTSLTTNRPVDDEIEDAVRLHGHLISLISNKWSFFHKMGVAGIARTSLLMATDAHVFWPEALDSQGFQVIERLIYDALKSKNQLFDRLRQEEFTTSFLLLDIGAVERKHTIPFLEASRGSAMFDVRMARSSVAKQWFSAIAKDEELRNKVLEYLSLRVEALTSIRELLRR